MRQILARFASLPQKTFKISYSTEYKTWLPHHVASDFTHPLHILQKRHLDARKREGLWWHVTSYLDLSRSSVVRTSCRKRLRNAFIEGLKVRGFDEHGRLVDAECLVCQDKDFAFIVNNRKDLSLTGSLRLHITPALIATKYADLKEETEAVINTLLQGVKDDFFSLRRSSSAPRIAQPVAWSKSKTCPQAPSQSKATPQPKLPLKSTKPAPGTFKSLLPLVNRKNKVSPALTSNFS